MRNDVLWDVKLCCLVETYQCFAGTSCLRLQDSRVSCVDKPVSSPSLLNYRKIYFNTLLPPPPRDRYSSVGVATRYGLEGPGIEFRWGRDSPHPLERPWAHPAFCKTGTGFFPGSKAARAWRWTPTPFSAEVKERLELYLYSPSGPSWPVLGWILPLTFTLIIIF